MRFAIFILWFLYISGGAFGQPASDKVITERSIELLKLSKQGKDGSFKVMKIFAECVGVYEVMAIHMMENDSKKMALMFQAAKSKVNFTANYFWSQYSKKPQPVIDSVASESIILFSAQLDVMGIDDRAVLDKVYYCGSLTLLQSLTLDRARKITDTTVKEKLGLE